MDYRAWQQGQRLGASDLDKLKAEPLGTEVNMKNLAFDSEQINHSTCEISSGAVDPILGVWTSPGVRRKVFKIHLLLH